MANEHTSRPTSDVVARAAIVVVGVSCLVLGIVGMLKSNGLDVPTWTIMLVSGGLAALVNR